MSRWLDLRRLGLVLLEFRAIYFAIVRLSNLTDPLRSVHVLPADWRWLWGNLAFMAVFFLIKPEPRCPLSGC